MIPGIMAGGSGRLWSPARMTNPPRLWYNDASAVTDAGGGACSQWDDISGNDAHLGQATSGARPLIVAGAQNGRRAIRFDGTADFMFTTDAQALDMWQSQGNGWAAAAYKKTVTDSPGVARQVCSGANGIPNTRFAIQGGSVANPNVQGLAVRRLDGDGGAGLNGNATTGGTWVMTLVLMDWTNGDGFVWMDGSLIASNLSLTSSGSTSNTGGNRFNVGAFSTSLITSGNNFMDMDCGEVLAGRTLPDSTEIDKLFGYIAWRWGLEGNLPGGHPYEFAAP